MAQERTPWVVVASEGHVTQPAADGTEVALEIGATLAEETPVKTGVDGKLVLAHGNDRVTVSANSAFSIPRDADPATGPSILQSLGTLLFKVEHTPGRRFEIQTPYLAAVVKGTVFTVTVSDADNSVHVAEGAVEVTASLSRDVALIHPGQTALVSSSGRTMSVVGARPEIKSENHAPGADGQKDAATANTASVVSSLDDDAGRITQTLGEVHLDVSTLTKGLVKPADDRRLADGVAAVTPATTTDTGAGGTPVAAAAGGTPATPNSVTPASAAPVPVATVGSPGVTGPMPAPAAPVPVATVGSPAVTGPTPSAGSPNSAGGNPSNPVAQAAGAPGSNKIAAHGH